ncbi:MAG: DNA polymerase III subunit alpha [Oligoflexia bacterium]|nr:DNA polymerase III subunit alpha [Oligoflexia bacterium]
MIFPVNHQQPLSGNNKMFVHLHLHSQYSLLESSIQLDDLVKKAVEYKMPAVAVTDYGNMFGAIEFYLEAKKAGIKPILGCEVFIAPEGRQTKSTSFPRLVLLCQNLEGYKNLCKLVSRGYTEGFYYKPRVDYELIKLYNQNLIALSGSALSDVSQDYLKLGEEKALEKIKFYKEIFGDRFYLEIQRTTARDEKLNQFLISSAKNLNIELVAANEPHYLAPEDSFAQEVLMCIQAGRTLQEDKRPKLPSDQFYFKSAEQMQKLFKDIPRACENTLKIAERCNVEFNFNDATGNKIYHLPSFPVPKGMKLKDFIKDMAYEGLKKRFEEMISRGEEVKEENKPNYYKRLDYELSVIDRMGFNGYFLIVQDFINYAKSQNIPVGPGRGSGAGSLVAYSLRITDLDPIKYNLLFERFLNPERISMPDFDVDFCQDRRSEVINYVTKKYGTGSVAQIITFGKLQTRAAIRDVGRALGIPYSEVDAIAKMVPEKLGITLTEAIEQEPRFKEMSENDPKVDNLLKTALKLEGLTRHASIHAAGVIISNMPLVEYCPLYKGNEGETVIQYDMINAEHIGLIKFDFLGLKTLTMISNTIKLAKINDPEDAKNLSTTSISLNDPKIYELLSNGDTAGVFQFEGDGISDLIKKFKPNCFEDITAINALYRPGPMNMLDEYVARKHGKIRVTYLFDELEEILKETYGIIVYQEQVQLIAAKIANYSLGEADVLRRAMGKKKPQEMAKQKERFLKGAKENKYDLKKAEELFDLMAKFAEYGFNKSHAAAYCVVAAQTAYLKAKYPVEFYAALITTEMSDTDKIVKYIRDATKHKIKVRGPDVNYSDYFFSAKNGEIVFGLGGVKGVGQAAVEAIMEARAKIEDGIFASISEFFENVDLRRVNKKVIECLIKSGAFDSLHANRAQLFSGFENYLEVAEKKKRDRELGQVSLFEQISNDQSFKVELAEKDDWLRSQKLSYEKEVLGFYISDHPLNGLESILKNHVNAHVSQLSLMDNKKKVIIGGMMGEIREIITKKGNRMAFANFEDQTGSVGIVIFPEVFLKYQHLIKSSKPLILTGNWEKEDSSGQIITEEFRLVESLAETAREVVFSVKSTNLDFDINTLKDILKKHKGSVKSRIDIDFNDLNKSVSLDLDPEYAVYPSESFFEDIEKNLKNQAQVQVL